MFMEGIAVATHRNLSLSHPIFKFLAPHFYNTIKINSAFMTEFICPGGKVDQDMNFGREGMIELIKRSVDTWRMDVEGTLPEDLKNRGLDDTNVLPGYNYREDGMLLYTAIQKYAKAYVDLYYINENLLINDYEIQDWVAELVRPRDDTNVAVPSGGCGLKGVPGDGHLTNNGQLVTILTSIVYICSVKHAASNFPQYDEYAFVPNYPVSLVGAPPTTKDELTEKDIVAALPSKEVTLDIMAIAKVLATQSNQPLGDFEIGYVYDPKALHVVDDFRESLKNVSEMIQKRNTQRIPVYDYLDPAHLPNSISI